MKMKHTISLLAGLLVASPASLAQPEVPVNLPEFKEGQYVHSAPTVE
ncbi:MAG: cytochrome C, partial [Marinobacter sp.]|nr:cytochrome C [Marinobacter sp.]